MKRWEIGLIAFFAALLIADVCNQPRPTLGEPDANGLRSIVIEYPLEPPGQAIREESSVENDSEEFIEALTDDKRIGRKRKNKVEVACFGQGRDRKATIKFFTRRSNHEWHLKQTFEFVKDVAPPCNPEVKDFNNDGLNDLSYWSESAARGANELRTLFIYDRSTDKLVHIKNSNEYPNLEYNKRSKSLTAWHSYGATSTTFLRIDGNMLKEFASVSTGDELVVTTTDKNGRVREMSRSKMNRDDIFTRYSTYDPPKP